MNPNPLLDPEFLSAVQDAVRDPRSCVNTVPQHRIQHYLEAVDERVSAQGDSLRRAEEHLISVYREELAEVLYQSARTKILSRPLEETQGHRVAELATDLPRRGRHLSEFADRFDSQATADGLRTLTRDTPASRLIIASLRLVPRDDVRTLLVKALQLEGYCDSAVYLVRRMLSRRCDREAKAVAHSDYGGLLFHSQDYLGASEQYRRAAECKPDFLPYSVYRMTSAMYSNHGGATLEAVRELDRIARERPNEAALDECQIVLASAAQNTPLPESSALPSVRSRLPIIASRFANELL